MRNSHAAYASWFTASGAAGTASFAATTSPASGAYTSEAAFTDSTTAQASPAATLRPTAR